jgi:putative peptidoglycan lipid II flippase
MTADMLAALIPAMIMFSVIEILNRVYYAKKLVKVPMIASLSGIALNIVLCEIFIVRVGLPPLYIAVSSLGGQSLAALILMIVLAKKIKGVLTKNFFINFLKTIISSVILFVSLQFIYNTIKNDAFSAGLLQNIFIAAAVAVAGIMIYIALNLLLKTDLLLFLRRKNTKTEKE